MSLLVLDPEEEAAATIRTTLEGLGYDVLNAARSDAVADLCQGGAVQILFFSDLALLPQAAALPVGVGAVYVTAEPLSIPTVLQCMRHGVHDCWQADIEPGEAGGRVEALLAQMQSLTARANAELVQMRDELERDQRAGQYIQLGMLPPNPMGIGHFRLQHRVEPSLILSGDFVDYFQITDRHFACYVADVAGHGASSAFVTVLLKNFSRRLRREYRHSMLSHAGEILAWINRELIDQQIDKHVAMFVAVVDTRENVLHFSNAAHFPPALLVHDGDVQSLEEKGKPLGIFADATFTSRQVSFQPGARLVVFSDGILDLIDAESLAEKEVYLRDTVVENDDMDSLWRAFDASKLGPDDVSCLLVSHGV